TPTAMRASPRWSRRWSINDGAGLDRRADDMTAPRPHQQKPVERPAYSRESTVLRLPGAVSLDDLSPVWAWGGATGAGVRVAIIDSGVDASHPALAGCVDGDGGLAVTTDGNGEAV